MWECSHLKGRLLKLAQDAFKWGGDIQITPREGQITGTSARWGSLRLFWELFASPRETLHKYSVGSSLEECLQSNDAPQASNELWRARLSCSALSFRVCRALSMATPSNSALQRRGQLDWPNRQMNRQIKWMGEGGGRGRENKGEREGRLRKLERRKEVPWSWLRWQGQCLALLKAWTFLQKKHELQDFLSLNFHFKIWKVNSVPRLIFF